MKFIQIVATCILQLQKEKKWLHLWIKYYQQCSKILKAMVFIHFVTIYRPLMQIIITIDSFCLKSEDNLLEKGQQMSVGNVLFLDDNARSRTTACTITVVCYQMRSLKASFFYYSPNLSTWHFIFMDHWKDVRSRKVILSNKALIEFLTEFLGNRVL